MKSPKELSLEKKILQALEIEPFSRAIEVAHLLMEDSEVHAIQNYANEVSIGRLGFNDHGPVHMRMVTYNSIKMLTLLHAQGIKTCLEQEKSGTFEDSLCAVILAAFLHDLGMTVGRQDHELFSVHLALPIVDRILTKVFADDLEKKVIIRSLVIEGIAGHMATRKIHSLEAGLILVADGCDMTKGRARIPMALNTDPKVGDIHKYSANSIENVTISQGEEHPIHIEITMSSEVGFFQIEEVLIPKINNSPAKSYIELFAGVEGQLLKKYL